MLHNLSVGSRYLGRDNDAPLDKSFRSILPMLLAILSASAQSSSSVLGAQHQASIEVLTRAAFASRGTQKKQNKLQCELLLRIH